MDKPVFEFDEISVGSGNKQLSEDDFKELKKFILPKRSEEEQSADEEYDAETLSMVRDASVCMTLGSKYGKEIIRVKNYVGVVSLSSGTLIEILPKTANKAYEGETEFARELVAEMLFASGNISYKSFQYAKLGVRKNVGLYEVFIRFFLDKLNQLYKKGLKAGYVSCEENEKFLKGKLLFNEHIKRNFAHRERFFVGYETFSFDRAENRLIKSTLLYLKGKSREENNRRDIRRMLLVLDEITTSKNYEDDFKRCESGRTGKDYAEVLKLCEVFLARKSFTTYSGKHEATALLFPMDKLFEKYVAHEMALAVAGRGWEFSSQDREKYLFNESKFLLRPDIVLKGKNDERIIIDTKWKRLSKNSGKNYGVSQADMYQAYAYHTRYDNVKKVVLLYPLYEDFTADDYKSSVGGLPVTVQLKLFDLQGYIKDKKPFLDCIKPQISDI